LSGTRCWNECLSKTGKEADMSDDYVLYDGQCPACSRYVAATGLAGRPDITLIDARHAPALVAEHAAAGRNIDDGMVVAVDGVMHFGADATRKLAEIGQPVTPDRRFLLWFVGRAPWARALYPMLCRPLIDPHKIGAQ
jgi:predicted DCC family thiol-disulfide oxidoreductase YuxK